MEAGDRMGPGPLEFQSCTEPPFGDCCPQSVQRRGCPEPEHVAVQGWGRPGLQLFSSPSCFARREMTKAHWPLLQCQDTLGSRRHVVLCIHSPDCQARGLETCARCPLHLPGLRLEPRPVWIRGRGRREGVYAWRPAFSTQPR